MRSGFLDRGVAQYAKTASVGPVVVKKRGSTDRLMEGPRAGITDGHAKRSR